MSTERLVLRGSRILVVEDLFVIAESVAEILQDSGARIVGPVGDLDGAMQMAAREAIDVAVLDIMLRGRPAYGVAEILRRRAIPFMFLTGYGDESVPAGFCHTPRLGKPFRADDLVDAVRGLIPPMPEAA